VNQTGMQSNIMEFRASDFVLTHHFKAVFTRFVGLPLDVFQLGNRGVVLIFPLLLHDKTGLTLLLKVAQLIAGAASLLLGPAKGSA
jgi:hypothetical protein